MAQPELNLDLPKSFQFLAQYVETAQQKGAYVLQEAELLKRAVDVVLNNVEDKDVDKNLGVNLLVQGVQKGQRHGAYSLADAALLHKVIMFLVNQSQPGQQSQQAQVQQPTQVPVQEASSEESDNNDLSELSQPVPLRPKEI